MRISNDDSDVSVIVPQDLPAPSVSASGSNDLTITPVSGVSKVKIASCIIQYPAEYERHAPFLWAVKGKYQIIVIKIINGACPLENPAQFMV